MLNIFKFELSVHDNVLASYLCRVILQSKLSVKILLPLNEPQINGFFLLFTNDSKLIRWLSRAERNSLEGISQL